MYFAENPRSKNPKRFYLLKTTSNIIKRKDIISKINFFLNLFNNYLNIDAMFKKTLISEF